MIRTKHGIVLGSLDLDGGAFTYGNRVALSEIFSDPETSEYEKMKRAHKELFGYSCRWLRIRWRVKRLEKIVSALASWVEREQKLLNYQPTADEISAGISELGKKVGAMSTIKALAKAYSTDPDEVLKWSYSKVFGILFTDLEERKYETKLRKIQSNKMKRK